MESYKEYMAYKLGQYMQLILSGGGVSDDELMPLMESIQKQGVMAWKSDLVGCVYVETKIGEDLMPISDLAFVKHQYAMAYAEGLGQEDSSIIMEIKQREEDLLQIRENIKKHQEEDRYPLERADSTKKLTLGESHEALKEELHKDLVRKNIKLIDGGKVDNTDSINVNRNFRIIKND